VAAAEGPTAGHAPSPPARKKGRRVDAARISWPVWGVMFGGFGLITGILLWFGGVIVVRCDRIEGRVDVTVEQRILGVLPVRTERLADVVKAGVERKPGGPARRGSRGGPADPQLRLDLRDGRVWYSQPVRYSVGTPPWEMAKPIQEFIDRSSAPSLRFWWLQWVLAALSVPLLLIWLLFLAAGVNMARQELGLGRS
jgi:hypothetical protein